MGVKFLDLHMQYESIKSDIDTAISNVIRDSAFISGEYATRFELTFSAYHQSENCISCGNGTDAIEIALEAMQLPKGGEIIVPANTFIASSEAVSRAGYRVVFCDCNDEDYTISPESIRSKLSSTTIAVMAVHLYGQPCDMDAVLGIARERGLRVIEDCAQAHGAEYRGRRVGTLGDVGTFSFYPGKNLGAYGDAGAIVTNNKTTANRARMIANHGRVAKYDHEFEGRNSRLDGIQAAILSVKLGHLENWIARRIAVAEHYDVELRGVGDLVLPVRRDWARHVYHLYVVRTKHRAELQSFLKGRGVETGVHYPISLPKLKAYSYCGQAGEPFFANAAASELLSLPIGDHMSPGDASEVVSACRAFFA
jgi:dTDP-4-amino-4,6-dideoxygalactose transaminase